MMKILVQILLIFSLPVLGNTLYAQSTLSSPTADKVRVQETPIFIHIVNDISDAIATLTAANDGVIADFDWYKFDIGALDYITTPIKTESNVMQSEVNNLGAGGYRVDISTGGVIDTTMYAWVLMDEKIKINSITYNNNCKMLELTVSHTATNFYSYYVLSNNPVRQTLIASNPKITWKTMPDNIYDGLDIDAAWKTPLTVIATSTEVKNPAPLTNATYTAVIKNDFGNESDPVSTAQIPAIAVYPVMKAEEQQADGNWVETKTLKGSALYKLRFDHSESKNADSYTWIGYDNYNTVQTRDRVLWTYTTNSAADKAYVKYDYMGEVLDGYLPGQYRDSLIVLNSVTGCESGIDLQFILGANNSFAIVEASKFDPMSLPNVFTPNGDGINDVFKFVTGNEPVSMKTITLRIFDRGGKELYYYNGRVSDWQGWNGKVKGTGADCSVGVYYYEISGTGWDNIPYSGKPYRGFVHLFKE